MHAASLAPPTHTARHLSASRTSVAVAVATALALSAGCGFATPPTADPAPTTACSSLTGTMAASASSTWPPVNRCRSETTRWRQPEHGQPLRRRFDILVSGRYDNVVYAISTTDGHLIKKIPAGKGPRGLSAWPLPGRYSLGHTGILR